MVVDERSKALSMFVLPSNCRNERGREMLSLIKKHLEITPTTSSVKLLILSYFLYSVISAKLKFSVYRIAYFFG